MPAGCPWGGPSLLRRLVPDTGPAPTRGRRAEEGPFFPGAPGGCEPPGKAPARNSSCGLGRNRPALAPAIQPDPRRPTPKVREPRDRRGPGPGRSPRPGEPAARPPSPSRREGHRCPETMTRVLRWSRWGPQARAKTQVAPRPGPPSARPAPGRPCPSGKGRERAGAGLRTGPPGPPVARSRPRGARRARSLDPRPLPARPARRRTHRPRVAVRPGGGGDGGGGRWLRAPRLRGGSPAPE